MNQICVSSRLGITYGGIQKVLGFFEENSFKMQKIEVFNNHDISYEEQYISLISEKGAKILIEDAIKEYGVMGKVSSVRFSMTSGVWLCTDGDTIVIGPDIIFQSKKLDRLINSENNFEIFLNLVRYGLSFPSFVDKFEFRQFPKLYGLRVFFK